MRLRDLAYPRVVVSECAMSADESVSVSLDSCVALRKCVFSRVEHFALLLARHNRIPAIVVKGGEVAPFLISPTGVMPRTPGRGVFTCCSRNHVMTDPDGIERNIPCDKSRVGVVILRMLQKRREFHLGFEDYVKYRLWTAFTPVFLSGLPCDDVPPQPTSVTAFLADYRFNEPTSEENQGSGVTPIIIAALSGNLPVLIELISRHHVQVDAPVRFSIKEFSIQKGATALHCCAAFCPTHVVRPIIAELLTAGADPNATTTLGATPAMAAAAFMNVEGLEALIHCSPVHLDLERGLKINQSTALAISAYLSTPEVVNALIQAGAVRTKFNDHGSTILIDACQNPTANSRTLELCTYSHDGQRLIDVNYQQRPRTLKWAVLDTYYIQMVRRGVYRSDMAVAMAHCRGQLVH